MTAGLFLCLMGLFYLSDSGAIELYILDIVCNLPFTVRFW